MSLTRLPKTGGGNRRWRWLHCVLGDVLVLTAMYAGPLWRDETNTCKRGADALAEGVLEQSDIESFPPLWPLVLRGGAF